MSSQSNRISLEIAHKVLATFGITSPTPAYERWVKDDGFDIDDFLIVLRDSSFVLIVDWRAWLQEELDTIAESLAILGVKISFELDEDGESGQVVGSNGSRADIAYRPNDDDKFDDVIRAIQSVAQGSVEFRASPYNGGNDTFVYGVLSPDEWADLESEVARILPQLFVPIRQMAG
jgi:hypothetical protein